MSGAFLIRFRLLLGRGLFFFLSFELTFGLIMYISSVIFCYLFYLFSRNAEIDELVLTRLIQLFSFLNFGFLWFGFL